MQRVGKVTIKVGGLTLDSMPGASLDTGGTMRDTVVGSNKVLGFSEKPKEASVECTVALGKGQSIRDFDTSDATITFACDTGQVYSLPNAWLAEPAKLTANDGGPVSLKYVSDRCEEIG